MLRLVRIIIYDEDFDYKRKASKGMKGRIKKNPSDFMCSLLS